jgi:hypothetical protein
MSIYPEYPSEDIDDLVDNQRSYDDLVKLLSLWRKIIDNETAIAALEVGVVPGMVSMYSGGVELELEVTTAYQVVKPYDAIGVEDGIDADLVNGTLTIITPGRYMVWYQVTSDGTNNVTFINEIFINEVPTGRMTRNLYAGTGDIRNANIVGVFDDLLEDDIITARCAVDDGTDDITIHDLQLIARRIS